MFLTEYFDTQTNQGFIEFKSDGAFQKIYYRNDTEEIFMYNETSCQTLSLSNIPEGLESMVLRTKGYTIIGASGLFISPLLADGYKSAYQGPADDVRGIHTEKWSTCFVNETEPFDIFFSDPTADLGYGTNTSVPVRIQQGKETTDIMMMGPYENDTDNVFKIPIGLGCTRLAKNLPKPPDLSKVTLEFHSELTFSTPTRNGSYSYMSHLDIIYNTEKQLFSYILEPWESAVPVDPSLPHEPSQEIWDAKNGLVYKQGKKNDRPYCAITSQSNYSLKVDLPDKNSANMLELIFLDYDVLQDASYLGQHIVRGIPSETFEISTGRIPANVTSFTRATITYHYLPEKRYYGSIISKKSLPIKVSVQTFILQDGQERPHFTLVANIHDISTSMEGLNKKLNVVGCYKNVESSTTWAQIGFPVLDGLLLLAQRTPYIKHLFLEKLFSVSSLSPLRVPRVMVDFTSNMIHVTALILERPNLKGDFMEKKNFALKVSDFSETAITLDDCLKLCLSNDYADCSIASYCGASCYTSRTTAADKVTALKKTAGCNAYIKKQPSNSKSLPLTRDALATVEDVVKKSEFVLFVDAGDEITKVSPLTLIAESMDDSIDYFPFTSIDNDGKDLKKDRRGESDIFAF
ncbi:unnamed protein product, partial [Ixodes hexagonus]